MIKLFYYECRRMIGSKYFLALLLLTSIYCYQLLTGTIILGSAYTAPFSAWSYGSYLSYMLPLLVTALLLFITLQYSKQARSFQVLAKACPFPPAQYALLRCLSIAAAYFLLCLCVIVISILFYLRFFHRYPFHTYVIPTVLTLLPALFFTLGIGLTTNRLYLGAVYLCILVFFILAQLTLPLWADFSGVSFFTQYPLTLPADAAGEPAFHIPLSFGIGKLIYTLTGILLILTSLRKHTQTAPF